MRNFWVAIIGVLMIASFAGTSFATAPVVQDIPDFRLLTGSGQVEDFDLNDYVTDYDDDPADLLWTIEDADGIAAALGADPNDNLLDIGASATVAQGTMILRATDANEYSEDTSVVKYSSLMLMGPGLTEDYNLFPATDDLPRTLVIEADGDVTTMDITDLIQPAQAGTVELSVSIADLDGNLLAGDNTASAEYGELSAAIQVDGTLVVSAPAGAYPLTGEYQLSGAYRVGVKAKLADGMGAANWDGLELLVSHARFPTNRDQNTAEVLNKFGNFETVSGALPTTPAAMRALPSASNPRWNTPQISGGATATIVSTGIPTSTWNATEGQALEVNLPAAGSSIYIQSEFFTDVQPGETLTFAMNLTTNVTDVNVPDFVIFMGSSDIPSNWCGMTLGKGANTLVADNQVPQNNEWRTVKTTFVADTVGAAVPDGASTVNVYSRGYVAVISITGTGPAKAWIDKVRIYRDKSDIDKALGATKVSPVLNAAPKNVFFNGTFGSGATTLSALGWFELAGQDQGAAAINTEAGNNRGFNDSTNSLEIYMDNAIGRTSNQVEFVYCDVDLNATAATGGSDNRGDGIIGASLWFKTDAAAPKDAPGFMFGLADFRFMNTPFVDAGYAGAPLDGAGWKKVQVSSARYDYAGRYKMLAIVRAEDLPVRTNWGSFQTPTTKFGAESDAHLFIDDVEVHKVQDDAMYFDRSVFPVAD